MSVLPAFEHVRGESVESVVAQMGFDDVPYAGGTELLLAMRIRLLRPERLIDLKRIPELQRIELVDGSIEIGGAVSHIVAARHPLVADRLPMLSDVLGRVGNVRVRTQGTLGGNLCFAEPKSDVAAALIALDAEVDLRSTAGMRTVAVDEFVIGAFYTVREPEELLTTIRVPVRPDLKGVYLKYQTMERPTVGVAAVREGATRTVVVAAVGERPVRFVFPDDQPIDPAAVADGVDPEADLTGSVDYKRHVTRVYVERAARALEESA
ncbi:MAG TPA: FAD binding domain-containing protein [Acidimicrobiia bacterium]|nr:FAD binding domain-containing protein [Acidimicrobiia bacterium]